MGKRDDHGHTAVNERWTKLSEFVLRLRHAFPELVRDASLDDAERDTALSLGWLTRETGSTDAALERLHRVPAMVNVAALASAVGNQIVVHELRPGAVEQVHETDLHSLPGEPPRLFRRAWLIDAGHPEKGERLFGDTVSLGGYQRGDSWWLVGYEARDAVYVGRWTPEWKGGELEAGVALDPGILLGGTSREAHQEWTQQAARFALVLGLLLDASGSPIVHYDEGRRPPQPKGYKGPPKTGTGWTVRHVSLSQTTSETRGGGGAGTPPAQINNLTAEAVTVRGHLKRQRHGPGNAEVKWVYVAGYQARRWVAPNRRVVVTG